MKIRRLITILGASVLLVAIVVYVTGIGTSVTVQAALSMVSITLGGRPPQNDIATNGPTSNTGSAWTNPTNVYADGTSYASITSGSPSGNNVWGTFGLSVSDPVMQVRVRYDAYYASVAQITYRSAGAKAAGTGAVTPALPASMSANDIVILTATTIAGGSISITADGSITPWTAITGSPIDVTGGDKLYVWWGRYSSGSTGPTVTPGSDHICAGTVAYYNVTTGTPIEAQNTGTETTSDTSLSFFTNFSTTSNGAMVILVSSSGADTNTAQHSNQANSSLTSIAERQDYETSSGGGGGYEVVEGFKATAGTAGTWTATLASTSPKAYVSFALTPADAPDQIRVDVSWDGGSSWSSKQTTALTSSETTYWYDVTSATSWTAAKLADGQLQVRADANAVGTANEVRLDWLAVEVTYGNTSTRSPTANTGSAWTNPTNAYADGTNYASITSGAPSGSNTWGTYGFSVSDYEISQVRVRYDAYSAGYSAGATSQTVRPDGSGGDPDSNTVSATYSTGSTFYGVVDETSYSDADYYTMVTNGGGRLTVTGPAFSIPAGATIANVTIYYRGTNGGTASFRPCLKIGTTYYDAIGTVQDPSTWTTYDDAFTTNPKTGVAWTVSDLNRSGGDSANYLNAFGTVSTDCNPDNQISWLYIVANYTPASEYDDQIRVDVSWDGGSTWSSTQNTVMTSAEVTTWYDVTAATTWTATKLNDTNLKVRALAYTVGNAESVRLDWLPVEVTYSVAEITNTPSSKAFGVVTDSNTYNTGLDFFTVTNSGSVDINVTISGTDMTGGTTWTLSDTATPGSNTIGFKAGLAAPRMGIGFSGGDTNLTLGFSAGDTNSAIGYSGQGDYAIVVKKSATYNTFIYQMPAGAIYKWGLQFLTPTASTDGTAKSGTITLTASAAS